MIPYIAIALVVGIFVGIGWRNFQVVRAVKNGTVLIIDGDIYSVKKEDRRVDPGGVR